MLRNFLFGLLALSASSALSQSMFDNSIIHDINIQFYDADWDNKLDSLAALSSGTGSGTGRILADVTINGTLMDSCGVRYKGNSSQDPNSNKNPFNIDLNYVKAGQSFQYKDKIKLANCFSDPSMVREALMYELSNDYMDAPRASFVRLAINGNYTGIYTNTESIDNEFLDEHYGNSGNAFFKCDPVSFEVFGDNSNLAHHPDTMAYDTLYDMKSTYGLTELQDLTYQLEFFPQNIDQYLDVDRVLWFLAVSSAFVHNDGYTGFAHNFYVYKMNNGKWSIILWDVNMSFGGLPWNGAGIWAQDIQSMQEQDPFLHDGAPNFRPLIANLLSQPRYRKMYVAHFKTILDDHVVNGNYLTRAEEMSALIDADRQIEPYNEYTYQEFLDNLYDDNGTGFGLRAGIENLMEARLVYLNGLTEFQALQPTLSNESVSNTLPEPYSTVTFTVEAADEDQVFLGYKFDEFDAFTTVEMFDDGLHNDGAAADGVYGVDVTLFHEDVEYYFYAENANAGRFLPRRAQYEFFTLPIKKGLVINELSAKNWTIADDLEGDYDDWIEIYNNSDAPINLNEYRLSDKGSNLTMWAFPNFTLQPDSYFIVWCDSQLTQAGVHANFKLNGGGEKIYLSDQFGFLIDEVEFPQQFGDITYGRLQNGDGPFNYLLPTFGTENGALASVEQDEVDLLDVELYPNPTTQFAQLQFSDNHQHEIVLMDMNGRMLLKTKGSNQVSLDVSDFAAGVYVVWIDARQSKKLIIR